jgi:hypothetical protein
VLTGIYFTTNRPTGNHAIKPNILVFETIRNLYLNRRDVLRRPGKELSIHCSRLFSSSTLHHQVNLSKLVNMMK